MTISGFFSKRGSWGTNRTHERTEWWLGSDDG